MITMGGSENTTSRTGLRLAIVGATGGTGLELTRQALEHGHNVRVLVRNPNRMTVNSPNMRVVLGNALDRESVTKTLLGSDAVLCCLGQRTLLRNTHVCSEGVHLILSVMKAQGLKRLVVESAFGAGESLAYANLLQRVAISTLLWAPFEDKNLMEPEVKMSGLDWTLVRPPALTNGPRTGRYAAVLSGRPRSLAMSRGDVAAAMLQAVEERLWIGEAPALSAS